MKKISLLIMSLCMAVVVSAQELPYSKYLSFEKKDFKENGFKFDGETNTWAMRKVNGWHTTFNVLAIIADAKRRCALPAMIIVLWCKWVERTRHRI